MNAGKNLTSPSLVVRIARYVLPLIFLGLAVHLLLPQVATLEHSMQVLQQMALWAVLLAVIAQVLSYLGSGYMLKSIVQLSDHHFSTIRATIIVLASYSLGMIAGGMVGSTAATYKWVQKEGVKPELAGLAGTIPGFFNSGILVLVSLVGLVHLLIVHQLTHVQAVSFILILLLLGGLVGLSLWGFRHRSEIKLLSHRLGSGWSKLRKQDYSPQRIDVWLKGVFDAWDMMIKGGWQGPVLGASLNILFDMATLYLLFIAARHTVTLGILLMGYGLPLILGRMAFVVPGGVGVVEGTMVALYRGLGVPDSVAVVVVLAYRFLSFWLPLLLGFPLILILQKREHEFTKEIRGG